MPYIHQAQREELEAAGRPIIIDAGELNYCITKLCNDYVISSSPSYATFNTIIGVLECAKQEFYRRLVAPYEDLKCAKNGDVYEV
jgi:hypothetical protein